MAGSVIPITIPPPKPHCGKMRNPGHNLKKVLRHGCKKICFRQCIYQELLTLDVVGSNKWHCIVYGTAILRSGIQIGMKTLGPQKKTPTNDGALASESGDLSGDRRIFLQVTTALLPQHETTRRRWWV